MMLKNAPRVVSLVPSWTETLIAAKVEVVGKTRFCIHPAELVNNIPQVGGTKALQIDKIISLRPDFVVVDKEENTKAMASELIHAGCKLLVTDVSDIRSAAEGLARLSKQLQNSQLTDMSWRYQQIPKNLNAELFFSKCVLLGTIDPNESFETCEYVIWKKPFMVVGKNTFIAENLKLAGIHIQHIEKYPALDESEIKKAFCLFSSEPYPFVKVYDQLLQRGFRGVVVDGEKLSWFGIRNLNFLESCAQ